jgi:hypothetical protein
MHLVRRFLMASLAGLATLLSLGCGAGGDSPGEAEGAAAPAAAAVFRYNREYVFLAPGPHAPLVVPFTFRATDDGAQLERVTRGWLARGATWDRFLEESGRTSRVGGVWRVVPQGDLRIVAGGPAELEALRFERGERRLRLDLEAPLTPWNQGGDTRFRLLRGRLSIGPETFTGPVLEILRVERALEDGWPAPQDFDALFLTSGDSMQFVLAEKMGGTGDAPGYAWTRLDGRERSWERAEIRWLELRPYQDARRDVPRRWSFQIPGSGIAGELEAVGSDAILGPERGGRRAVEMRFTVEGWVQVQGRRASVAGTIRHTQQ